MKYLESINQLLNKEVSNSNNLVIFGQNVSAGSFIGGFTKGFITKGNGRIINTTNTENSLVGFGFGIMAAGGSSIFFMKQLDFLFLGIDHLVNTYNIIRGSEVSKGSFTIMPIVVDGGYQGPQSSSNNLGDFCSIAHIPGFTITNQVDAEKILAQHLTSPGFRIIAVSQRLFKEEMIVPPAPLYISDDLSFFQYSEGKDATIVSFNFSFEQAWKLFEEMKKDGMEASLFNVNMPVPIAWDWIVKDVIRTQKIILIDDSKSQNISLYSLRAAIANVTALKKCVVLTRTLKEDWLHPVSDVFTIDNDSIIQELKK